MLATLCARVLSTNRPIWLRVATSLAQGNEKTRYRSTTDSETEAVVRTLFIGSRHITGSAMCFQLNQRPFLSTMKGTWELAHAPLNVLFPLRLATYPRRSKIFARSRLACFLDRQWRKLGESSKYSHIQIVVSLAATLPKPAFLP